MGYRTDFIGHIEIDPPLNVAEHSYLTAFAESRRFIRKGGPYWVPDHPLADDREEVTDDVDAYNTPPKGQPGLWCPWRPGGASSFYIPEQDGRHYQAGPWLEYLISHFLRRGAAAQRSGSALFEEFTFDHDVTGVVAAYRYDEGVLWLIRAMGSTVVEEPVWSEGYAGMPASMQAWPR